MARAGARADSARTASKREREKRMVGEMIALHCRARHGGGVPVGQAVLAGVWLFHIFYFSFGVKTRRAEAEA